MKHTLETLKNLEDYIRELDKFVGIDMDTLKEMNDVIYFAKEKLNTKPVNNIINPVNDIDDFLEALNAEYLHKTNCFCSD